MAKTTSLSERSRSICPCFAQPSGDVMDTSKPYTLPLNNEIALCRCVGAYTQTYRKLWATLVALAWDNLGKKSINEATRERSPDCFSNSRAHATGRLG